MKKKSLFAVVMLIVMVLVSVLSGCSGNGNFGSFCQNGRYLKEIAKKSISYSQAIEKVRGSRAKAMSYADAEEMASIDEENGIHPLPEGMVDSLVRKYSEVQIKVKYYNEKNKLTTTTDPSIQASRLEYHLKNNFLETSIGLRISNIIMLNDTLNDMEKANAAFSDRNAYFTHPYTYHTDRKKNLVIQMHAYMEMSSLGLNGGIDCNVRQDTEVQYDSENKITKWQTSLGVWLASVNGIVREGYIYEVEFEWIKVVN